MGFFESSILMEAWELLWRASVAAARGAIRSVACRRGRRALGLASGDLCSKSLHHLISGRTSWSAPKFRMLAGRKPRGWDPSTKAATVMSALGWHGHHPSRADRGGAAALAR